ncbi:MAG: branched-chain amino acid ABC transporter permease [Devosia sp.]
MINTLLQGVLLGGYYALIAAGLSFMFSVMGIINLAHGSLAVLAAYALLVLAQNYGISPFLGLLVVLPLMAILGLLLQRFVLDRALRAGPLVPILATFGLSIVIDNALFEFFGANTRSLGNYIGSLSYDSIALPGNIYVGTLAVGIFVLAVVVLVGLQGFLSLTAYGRAIRATAEDADTAGLVGINARMATAVASAIALVMVGLAGAALGMKGTFDAYTGASQLLFAFESAVIGGTGSVWGTLLGGIVLALAQSIGATISPLGFLIAGHAVFLAVLFVRIWLAGGVAGLLRRRA